MKFRISSFRKRLTKADHSDQEAVTEILNSVEELDQVQKTIAWSPSIFKGWRSGDHWVCAQLLVLDIDNGDYNKFKELLAFYNEECLVTFTESHRGLKNGKQQADCFRATFFLKEECFEKESYKETLKQLQEKYIETGAEQGPDIIKYYWTSTGKHSELKTHFPGKKISLQRVKKNKEDSSSNKTELMKLPIVAEYLNITEDNMESRRNEFVNKITYIMASHGHSIQDIKSLVFSKRLERPLDERYERVIEDAFSAGQKLYEERKLEYGEKFFKNMPIETFFKEFIFSFDMTCSQHGIISLGERAYSDDIVLDHMIVEASKYQLKNRSKETLKALINVWKLVQIEERVKIMEKSIEFTEPSNEICRFVEAVTGIQNPLDIAVMKHWIWQVKRKFRKMDTKHHIMPIFYGKTRSGKTTAIEKLLEPIRQLTMIAELALVNDNRNDFNLIEKLVIFFDELGKAEKVVVSNLKQKITSSNITYRRLGTNQNMNGFNMCSFIGATNEPVIDAIVDPTSARRFYEMRTLDKCDWNIINSLNFTQIWQSINEYETTAPIEQHLFELSEAQEDIRSKDYVEEFVNEYGLKPMHDDKSKFASTMDLYLKLKEWLETQNKGIYIPSISKFSRKLKNFLDKAPVTREHGVPLNGFYVASCYLGKTVISSKEINLSREN